MTALKGPAGGGAGGEAGSRQPWQFNAMLDHTLTVVAAVAVWAFWRQYIKQQESTAAAGVVAVLTLTEEERETDEWKGGGPSSLAPAPAE